MTEGIGQILLYNFFDLYGWISIVQIVFLNQKGCLPPFSGWPPPLGGRGAFHVKTNRKNTGVD